MLHREVKSYQKHRCTTKSIGLINVYVRNLHVGESKDFFNIVVLAIPLIEEVSEAGLIP